MHTKELPLSIRSSFSDTHSLVVDMRCAATEIVIATLAL